MSLIASERHVLKHSYGHQSLSLHTEMTAAVSQGSGKPATVPRGRAGLMRRSLERGMLEVVRRCKADMNLALDQRGAR